MTSKRALTEEESGYSSEKKPRVEGEDDTGMGDESESDSESASDEWEVDEEVFAKGRVEPGSVLDREETEPEWDVDSYGEYVSDPEVRALFSSDEEYKKFRDRKIEVVKNKGFLPDPIKWIFALPNLEEPWGNQTTREVLKDIASLCVKKYNEEKGKSVEVVSVVRANERSGGRTKLYITFMAREYPNGPLLEYQAKAMIFAGGAKPPFPILCRPAPNHSSP
ncbi:unnamed protein product [Thlaspi arvense]|uniref:Uncharacterized protein n=1 Tax=Thlaspi arvense TaxID=13288 RepID=A0AAU9SW63_THLAR|nr:unnamed protein product [Thlaspi arvense]